MGGVLFIDEAYYLYKPDNERDYGAEAIEILLQVMENQRYDLVIIFAGYKERMDSFYESNPDFPDYSPEELLIIGKIMLEEQQYRLTEESENVLLDYIKLRMTEPHFANARSVRNAIDRARMRQANRMFTAGNKVLIKSDLVTIEPQDILRSRLFKE